MMEIVPYIESGLDFYKIRGRASMKRITGMIVLVILAMFLSSCHTQHCPHGNCTEEASPKPPEK